MPGPPTRPESSWHSRIVIRDRTSSAQEPNLGSADTTTLDPILVVSGRLGHEHVSTTLDVNAAYLPLADRDAASRIGQLLTSSASVEQRASDRR